MVVASKGVLITWCERGAVAHKHAAALARSFVARRERDALSCLSHYPPISSHPHPSIPLSPSTHKHSDAPTKEFLLSLNTARPADAKFVVADLDDTRLLVEPGCVAGLQAAVRARGDDLTYTAPADPLAG